MTPRFLETGTRLGRYVVRERLGRGAVATVYLAEDTESGAMVALKTLHEASGSQAERLKREIALARRIAHPGICHVFDIEEQDDLMFLTMEYIPGRTLETIIQSEGRLAPPRGARVLRSICAALGHAHALDILHRDLKPGNIILRPDDNPTILDFGYATGPDVARLTRTGVWVGTLQYVAPEILKNQPPSKRSDIYALGVTLYRALTGEYPFPGVTYGEVASAVLFRGPPPLRNHVPDIDRDLERLTLTAMAREPHDRPQHVGELEQALARLNLGDDVTDPSHLAPPVVIAGEKSLPRALAMAIEASTTQKEAMLATAQPAPPDPPLAATAPPPPPPAAPQPDPATLRAEHAELRESLRAARQERGIVAGDNATLDGLERTAELELSRGAWSAGVECLRLALAEIASVVIDNRFVALKLQRLHVRMRERGVRRDNPDLEPLMAEITTAFKSRAFDEANASLNRAFDALG